MSSVLHIPVTVDMSDLQPGVVKLMHEIKPEWTLDKLKFKVFTDGITNKLIGAHVGDWKDMILTRVYGEKTELFIDRDVEQRTMQFLNSQGCAKPLYCTFENGICYGFIDGQVFDDVMMKDRKYGALVARELARLHTLPVPASYAPGQTRSSYFLQFHKLLGLLPDSFQDPDKDKRYQSEVPRVPELTAAAEELERLGASWGEPLVLCHHDLLIKNLVYNQQEERVYFIDYEYAGMSYPELDIGDHFDEYAGIDEVDFSLYPSRDHQLFFLREYLTQRHRYHGNNNDVTDEEVEQLYKRVNKMALMAHLFWGVWGLVQACHSTIDFDFLDYGIMKIREYQRLRPGFLAL